MAGRRVTFLLLLLITFVFAIAYQEWLAWFLLAALAVLPLFSLVVSLPAMVLARFRLELPSNVTVGQPLEAHVLCRCPVPPPIWRYRVQAEHRLSKHRQRYQQLDFIPTDHCGTVHITVKKFKIYDYCGLFHKSVRLRNRHYQVAVRPFPVALPEEPSLDGCLFPAWKPKPGGGFAENHELRLYRPGDNLQQIHWKLSAKTGSLIVRQPMEPVRGRILVRMDLKGSPDTLDRKLGQLLWLGQRLLEKDIHFQIQCLTGKGVQLLNVTDEQSLLHSIDTLLDCPPAHSGSLADQPEIAIWQYFIGGDAHEEH